MEKNHSFYIKGNDGKDIYVYCRDEVEQPKAAVQIFHGMAEHSGRYAHVAEFLNSKGFVVYADDHRGHGRTAGSPDRLGYIGRDGFNKIIEDEYIILNKIKETYPQLPVIILGHSFGSFLAQEFIAKYGREIAGVILSGSSFISAIESGPGLLLASIQKALQGGEKKSYLIHKLCFSGYNKRIENPASGSEWLSRSRKAVQKYLNDPYCGAVFPVEFYYYFFKGLLNLYKQEKLAGIPKDLPVLIISGTDDPVGKYGAGVKKLYQLYKRIGLTAVEMKLYPGARHEVLNEINRDEVYDDVINWITRHITSKYDKFHEKP